MAYYRDSFIFLCLFRDRNYCFLFKLESEVVTNVEKHVTIIYTLA
jgi:hypothetical protein